VAGLDPKERRLTVGRKRHTGGRPLKEGKVVPLEGNPWGSGFRVLRSSKGKEREGHEEGKRFFKYPTGKSPRDAEAQEGKGLTSG